MEPGSTDTTLLWKTKATKKSLPWQVRQGDMWMVALGTDNILGSEQKNNRPFYVVSNTRYNQASQTPIGFFMSTAKHKKNNRFTVAVNNGRDFVNTSQIRTIAAVRLLRKLGRGSQADTRALMRIFQRAIVALPV